MTHFVRSRKCVVRMTLALAFIVCLSTETLAANDITGSARNQTQLKPAAGDDVVLLQLEGMREETRTKTDSRGMFALRTRDLPKQYLVRVIHQSVNYDQIISSESTLFISVFDASPSVDRIVGNIEILRAGTSGNLLHVSDMLEIINRSSPPMTRAGPRTLDVYLPANSRMDSVLAAGPLKMAVAISATRVAGEPEHYTVDFPLQPGTTRFAFNYDVPYHGHATFQTRHAYALEQLAVMLAPTMNFRSLSPAFGLLDTGNKDYQVYAANQLPAGDGPRFEIAGSGVLPPLVPRAQVSTRPPDVSPLHGAVADRSRAAWPPSPPPVLPSHNAFRAWPWMALGAVGALVMGVGLLLIWRGSKLRIGGIKAMSQAAPVQHGRLLLDLKKELSQLEADLSRGLITRKEFDATSKALLQALDRAVARVS